MVLDGYVRVSQVHGRSGERFISPVGQREQIEGWARRHGALIAEVFEELDESGARRDRPKLMRAIERVERGESGGLVVAYASRFGRSQLDGLIAIDRIVRAGGVFVSVLEGLDYSTDIGRHMLRSMLSWAEWELDRTRSNWETARRRAVARGLYLGARPFGYRKDADGRLEVDPDEGPLVSELFRRRAEGASLAELRSFLAGAESVTAKGNAWRTEGIRRLLARRTYLGEVHHGFVNPSAHPALTDGATWERAQLRNLRLPPRRGGWQTVPLLRGILRCAGCQQLMQTIKRDAGSSLERRWYLCRALRGFGPCTGPSQVADSVVEPYVEQLFWQELDRVPRRPAERRLDRLQAAVECRARELEAYRDNPRLPTTIGPDRFADGLAVRQRRVDRAQVELSRARLQTSAPPLPPADELRARWPSMTIQERRAVIAEVIDCAFLSRGRNQPIDERLFVCRRGTAPTDMPAYNHQGLRDARALDPSACSRPVRLRRREEDWSEERLREALTEFVAGRERWPSFPEFQAAGLASLYVQVQRHAGPRRWSALLHVPYAAPRRETKAWPEWRIRAELRTYLGGRTVWPSFRQFARDGRSALRLSVRWTGGSERWAREMGVELAPRGAPNQRWTHARMKADLARFVGKRDDWPPRREFHAAGLGGLYSAIRAKQARERLAAELGLRLPQGRVYGRKRWTDDAIGNALDSFLEAREAWPTRNEFKEAGLGTVHRILAETGTRDGWARRYGFDPPRRIPSTRRPAR